MSAKTPAFYLKRYLDKRAAGARGALRDVDLAYRLEPTAWPAGLSEGQPEAAPLRAYRAQALARSGNVDQACAELKAALELEPAGWIAAWLGEALRQAGRAAEARAAFDRAIELDRRYANAWAWRGTLRFSEGDAGGALADVERSLKLQPTPRAHRDRARILLRLGRVAESLDALEAAARLNPELGWDRLEDLDVALAAAPREPRLAAWRGEALLRAGRAAEALESLETAVAKAPKFSWARVWRAEARLIAGGDARAAAAELAEATKKDPGYARAWWARAEALSRLGRHDQALECLKRAARLYPYSARAWMARARVEEALGRPAAALACRERALRLCPDYKESR